MKLVRDVRWLGDQPVQPGTIEDLEPPGGDGRIGSDRGAVHRRPDVRERRRQPLAALLVRLLQERLVGQREQVEGDDLGGCLLGEQVDPGGGRFGS